MLEKVSAWCLKNKLFQPGDAIVIACSGGPDSLALTHVFLALQKEYGLKLKVAHLDHMFRGEASRQDACFVEEFCRKNNLPCEMRSVDVPAYAALHGLSDETAAREVRYAFLREVAASFGAVKIATAHHQGDQAETVLLHLFRGAGSQGLRGIQPVAGDIIRPFLFLTKKEIEAYCTTHALEPRLDETNTQTKYTRNKIRLNLIPQLQQDYNPAIEGALCRSAVLLGDEHDFVEQFALACWPKIITMCQKKLVLERQGFNGQPKAIKREILRLLVDKLQGDLKGIGFIHLEQLMEFILLARSGDIQQLPHGLRAYCRYGIIEFGREQASETEFRQDPIEIKVPGRTAIKGMGIAIEAKIVSSWQKPTDKTMLICDADSLEGPLFVRSRQAGDRFLPAGLNGSKKLKDFFIDEKINRNERNRIPLFCDQKEIFWVGGRRQNTASMVTEKTSRFLCLRIEDLQEKGDFLDDDRRY